MFAARMALLMASMRVFPHGVTRSMRGSGTVTFAICGIGVRVP